MRREPDSPPGIIMRVLRRLSTYERLFSISRDFEIEYSSISRQRGRIAAFFWLLWSTSAAFFYYLIFIFKWRTIMFRNYFKITFRTMKRNKVFSFINGVGLTVGMACVLLILIWVRYENSFEKFHEHADRIFRIAGENRNTSPPAKMVVSPPPMGPALLQEFPEIAAVTRLSRGSGQKLFSYQGKHFFESFYAVDPSFFKIFTHDFVEGDAANVMIDPYSMVLSERMAIKIFGNQDPVDKIVQFDQKTDFRVTGVIKNIPSNSHINRDIYIPFETWGKIYEEPLYHWKYWSFYTYILVKPGANIERIEEKFPDFTKKYGIQEVNLFLQPLKSIHLHSHFVGELGSGTQISTLFLFGSIAALILIIGCINYMNLTTARSSVRLKEIGTRKVVGAHRRQIAWQFLGESMIMSLISLGLSLVMVYFFLPVFNSLAERSLTLNGETLIRILPGMFLLVLFVGFFGGSYPAFLLSSFKPIDIIKGGSGKREHKTKLRNVLVVVQFSVSIILITATFLVKSQLHYILNKEMGFNRDQIVVIPLREPEISRNVGPLVEELKRNPRIFYVSSSMHLPNDVGATTTATWTGKPEDLKITIKVSETGYDFTELYGINIVEGRSFSREFSSDENGAFLLNESAVRALGNHFHLGMEFHHWTGKGKVVGVMQDYHHNSLHEKIMPLYVFLNPNRGRYLSLKIQGGDIPETIEMIQKTLAEFSPKYPFEFHFFDTLFHKAYLDEQKMERMFAIFSIIAVFIACMGVFGLSAFMADQKRKEIGIRKVLGAPVAKIIYLLSRDLLRLVLLANLIAWPVAYYAMNRWLQNFAYRSPIHPLILLLSSILALAVSFGTLSFQALKAATANPVDSLRYE
ncbi:MAG: ABC transporter permease [Candidatus Aminicenantes bacterium]|nr:ABC transporter permease [Candidatus Aminicenantes bacterium]